MILNPYLIIAGFILLFFAFYMISRCVKYSRSLPDEDIGPVDYTSKPELKLGGYLTDELVEELGFIYSKDKELQPSIFEIPFADFLQMVLAPNKPETHILSDAYYLERLATYYKHSVKDKWPYTFKQFVSKVGSGAWEARFAE